MHREIATSVNAKIIHIHLTLMVRKILQHISPLFSSNLIIYYGSFTYIEQDGPFRLFAM